MKERDNDEQNYVIVIICQHSLYYNNEANVNDTRHLTKIVLLLPKWLKDSIVWTVGESFVQKIKTVKRIKVA